MNTPAEAPSLWSGDLAEHLWRYAAFLEAQAAQMRIAAKFYPETFSDEGERLADEALAMNDLANRLYNMKAHLVRRPA